MREIPDADTEYKNEATTTPVTSSDQSYASWTLCMADGDQSMLSEDDEYGYDDEDDDSEDEEHGGADEDD